MTMANRVAPRASGPPVTNAVNKMCLVVLGAGELVELVKLGGESHSGWCVSEW